MFEYTVFLLYSDGVHENVMYMNQDRQDSGKTDMQVPWVSHHIVNTLVAETSNVEGINLIFELRVLK